MKWLLGRQEATAKALHILIATIEQFHRRKASNGACINMLSYKPVQDSFHQIPPVTDSRFMQAARLQPEVQRKDDPVPCGPFTDTLRDEHSLVLAANVFEDSVAVVHDTVPDPSKTAFAMFIPSDEAFLASGSLTSSSNLDVHDEVVRLNLYCMCASLMI